MTDSEILDFLRERFARLDARLDGIAADIRDLKFRVTSIEQQLAGLRADLANQSLRMDRIELRLDQIWRRLDLAPIA